MTFMTTILLISYHLTVKGEDHIHDNIDIHNKITNNTPSCSRKDQSPSKSIHNNNIHYNDTFIHVDVEINPIECNGLILLTTEYGMSRRLDHDACVNVINEDNMNCTIKNHNRITKRFNSMYCSKFIKTHPHLFGDKVLWIDTHYTKHNLSSLIRVLQHHNQSRFFSHWFNNNIDQEVVSARGQERYIASGINEQIAIYKARFEMPPYMFAMGFFLFVLDSCMVELFSAWWYHNIFYSFEDQVSFPLLLYNMNCTFEIDSKQPCYYITGSESQNCLNGKSVFLNTG